MKRLFDLLFSAALLIILSPFFLAVGLAIKLSSRGPVFYRGERIGLGGRPFRIYKFRSMVMDADRFGGPSTSAVDPRLTRVGRLIRKVKVDELSQLINVFLGDMSLVGPRPEVKEYIALLTQEERVILGIRPGITDWASIKFHDEGEIIARSGFSDPEKAYLKLIRPEKVRLQLKYVRERSFCTDLWILLKTFLVLFQSVFSGKRSRRQVKALRSELKNAITN